MDKPSQRTKTVIDILSSDAMKKQIAASLPKHVDPERIVRIALTVLRRSPQLMQCSQESLLGCVMTASAFGLSVDPVAGHAYLIPRGRECSLQIGWRGLTHLARNSGDISHISAEAVRENDEFSVELGSERKLIHKPNFKEDRGDVVCVYAVAKLKDGECQFAVMSVDEINYIRDNFGASNGQAWKKSWEEMAKKTAIRRLCKMLPLSADKDNSVLHAAEADDKVHSFDIEIESGEKKEKKAGLKWMEPPKPEQTNGAEEEEDGDDLKIPYTLPTNNNDLLGEDE